MSKDKLEIAVKVGVQSDLRFKGKEIKSFRALTLKELKSIVETRQGIRVIIIEKIKQSEYDGIKDFIDTFKRLDSINRVYFYVKDNDDITCGVADELDYDIYLDIRDLHREIENNFGVDVSTVLNMKTTTTDETVGNDIDFEGAFEGVLSYDEVDTKEEIVAKEVKLEGPNEDIIIKLEETKKDTKEEIVITDVKLEEPKEQIVITNKLEDTNDSLSAINKELNKALGDIDRLNDIIYVLEDEKNSYKSMLERLRVTDNIIEEPIELEEYRVILKELEAIKIERDELSERIKSGIIDSDKIAKLDSHTLKLEGLNSSLKDEIAKIELEKESLTKQVSELESRIEGLTGVGLDFKAKMELESMGRLKVECLLDKAIKRIACTDSSLDKEIKDLKIERNEQENKIIDLNSEIYKHNEKESSLNRDLQDLKIVREQQENTLVYLNNEIVKHNEKESALNKEIEGLKAEIEQQENKIIELDREIEGLRVKASTVDITLEACKKSFESDMNTLRLDKAELQGKLDLTTSQLIAKEYQYNELVKACGVDIDGANSLLENNRTLEKVIESLRTQIDNLNGEVRQARSEKIFAIDSLKRLDESNKQLKTSLNAVTYGINSGNGIQIPPCNYTGKGMIIPVFGSGSVGITTTAMSLATKLASSARVLYIDFDMVEPKADGWFKETPLVKDIPEVIELGSKATGLGILMEKQVTFFLTYMSTIIKRIANAKAGSLDYISGLHVRPDIIKLISADYTTFFNVCGNNYTYVIVDLGRLGSSEINDKVIKMVSDIAYRNVVVTNNNKFVVRNFKAKLLTNKIDNKIMWLLNMCENTSVDDMTKKGISPFEYGLVPFSMDLFGKNSDFSKTRLTRDKFDLFLKMAIN